MANVIDNKLNLSVLQRLDNSITAIVDSASQVALYGFSKDSHEWEKTEIEGALFVYKRSKKPQHGFVVINRVNTKNFVEQITNKLEFQIQIPFLLYRNGKGNIFGIWFYEQDHCKKIAQLLRGLSELNIPKQQQLQQQKAMDNKPKANDKGQKKENININNNNNFAKMDIMSLLTRAQEEYDKKSMIQDSVAPIDRSKQQQHGVIVKPTPLRANSLTMPNGSASVPLSVDSLFAQAGDGKHVYQGSDLKPSEKSIREQQMLDLNKFIDDSKPTEMSARGDILQKLLSSSNSVAVDHKEQPKPNQRKIMRARSATYSSAVGLQQALEKDLKQKLHISPKCVPVKQIASQVKAELPSHPELILGGPNLSKTEAVDIPILTPAMLELSSSFPNNHSYGSPSASFGKHSKEKDSFFGAAYTVSSSLPGATLPNNSSPAAPLLSPMDFKIPIKNCSPILGESPPEINEAYILHSNQSFDDNDMDLLLPKNLMHGSGSVNQKSTNIGVTPLTKYQLRESLTYMLQNDENFIDRLHECYLKSLKRQLNGFKSS